MSRPHLDHKASPVTKIIFLGMLAIGLLFTGYSLITDINDAGDKPVTWLPYILLIVALLIALGFEFVNGFHDTANAVATVIYTHSLPANFAVFWSGTFNFLGVLASSGTVAFGIISLLPVELILQVGSSAGFAMVFALLIAAILWNLGTWLLGLPASSSHTLIGSIIGVGIANALMHQGRDGTSGVDWAQATKVGYSLLLFPMIGFCCAALLLLALRALVKNRELYEAPKDNSPPPLWIRGLLILTCTGVSFHGSNDGQKGMGLIMLIFVGTVPIAYALNRAMPVDQMTQFVALAHVTQESLNKTAPAPFTGKASETISEFVRTKELKADVLPALSSLVGGIGQQIKEYGSLAHIPIEAVPNVRNDMYLVSEALKLLEKNETVKFDADTKENLKAFKKEIDNATKFIPLWVKISVAIALGLGTMVGWKRIVVTVGEKIGKSHLTLRTRGFSRTGRHADYWRSRYLRPAGFYDPSLILGRGRYNGGQQIGLAVVNCP